MQNYCNFALQKIKYACSKMSVGLL